MKILTPLKGFFRFISRPGLVPAAWVLCKAIREARRKSGATGHRFFAIWSPERRRLVTLTYDAYPGRTDSYAFLRRRGKFTPLSRKQFRAGSFFYTASRNGSSEMPRRNVMQALEILRLRYFASAPSPASNLSPHP